MNRGLVRNSLLLPVLSRCALMLSEKNCSIDGTEPRSAEAILRQTSISSINSNKTVASGLSGKDETIGHQRLMKRQFLSVIECGIMDSSGMPHQVSKGGTHAMI